MNKTSLILAGFIFTGFSISVQAQGFIEEPMDDKPAAKTPAAKAPAAKAPAAAKAQEFSSIPEFAELQKKIKETQTAMAKQTRSSQKKRMQADLKRHQVNLRLQTNKTLGPLQIREKQLQSVIKASKTSNKQDLQKKLIEVQKEIANIKKEANLEKWCAEPTGKENAVPEKKTKKNKKKRRSL